MIIIESGNILTVDKFIRLAFAEDTGDGDHTSLATIGENDEGLATVKIKEDGIIAGVDLAVRVLQMIDATLKIDKKITDGSEVKIGDVALLIHGNVRSLLKAERLLLNCMQRMSGIATLTNKFVKETEGTKSKILDTRKTTPNFRQFEKYAVKIGGGMNHRFGLYDMILIKDNHVDAAGGITNALKRVSEYLKQTGKNLPVEIETRNIDEVKQVMEAGIANRIMLDNFSPELLMKAVQLINGKYETEASGGITMSNVRSYALSGVDFISVGALTHSYKSMDISMKISK